MTLAGIHFKDGGGVSYGGALAMTSAALVSRQGCKLSSNQASAYGGGIAASGSTINLYTTIFEGNTATHDGDDVFTDATSPTAASDVDALQRPP